MIRTGLTGVGWRAIGFTRFGAFGLSELWELRCELLRHAFRVPELVPRPCRGWRIASRVQVSRGAASAVAALDGVFGAMRAPLEIQTFAARASRSAGDGRAGDEPRTTCIDMRGRWVGCGDRWL